METEKSEYEHSKSAIADTTMVLAMSGMRSPSSVRLPGSSTSSRLSHAPAAVAARTSAAIFVNRPRAGRFPFLIVFMALSPLHIRT